jgi:hypothetical protein
MSLTPLQEILHELPLRPLSLISAVVLLLHDTVPVGVSFVLLTCNVKVVDAVRTLLSVGTPSSVTVMVSCVDPTWFGSGVIETLQFGQVPPHATPLLFTRAVFVELTLKYELLQAYVLS